MRCLRGCGRRMKRLVALDVLVDDESGVGGADGGGLYAKGQRGGIQAFGGVSGEPSGSPWIMDATLGGCVCGWMPMWKLAVPGGGGAAGVGRCNGLSYSCTGRLRWGPSMIIGGDEGRWRFWVDGEDGGLGRCRKAL